VLARPGEHPMAPNSHSQAFAYLHTMRLRCREQGPGLNSILIGWTRLIDSSPSMSGIRRIRSDAPPTRTEQMIRALLLALLASVGPWMAIASAQTGIAYRAQIIPAGAVAPTTPWGRAKQMRPGPIPNVSPTPGIEPVEAQRHSLRKDRLAPMIHSPLVRLQTNLRLSKASPRRRHSELQKSRESWRRNTS
jgi:hypothetical protein